MNKDEIPTPDATAEDFDAIAASEDYINALAAGRLPACGSDDLARMILELRAEVCAPIPEPPVMDDLCEAEVVSMASSRAARKRRRRSHAGGGARHAAHSSSRSGSRRRMVLSGVVGAAAAAAIIVGAGGLVLSADPGSALWPVRSAIVGNNQTLVELTASLEKADKLQSSGDTAGAAAWLDRARALLEEVNERDRIVAERELASAEQKIAEESSPTTVTVEASPSEDPTDSPEPATVTTTVTVTVTALPSESAEKSADASTSSSTNSSAIDGSVHDSVENAEPTPTETQQSTADTARGAEYKAKMTAQPGNAGSS